MTKAKDSVERARVVAQQRQLGQGALFIIDNAGSCPPGVAFHAHTNAAIEQHLSEHTYHQQEKGVAGFENRVRVDVSRMRKYMADLGKKARKGATSIDALFRGLSDIVKTEVKESYGYDKYNFSEGDLPGYEEELEAKAQRQQLSVAGHSCRITTTLATGPASWIFEKSI